MALIKLNSRAIPDDTVIASDIADGSISTAKLAADAVTNAKLAADAVTTPKIADTVNFGRRNLIINGAMEVAQRATTYATAVSNGYHTVDRIRVMGSSNVGQWTISQDSDVPAGFVKSLKYECTTADTSLASTDHLGLGYFPEGHHMNPVSKGTSGAKSMTLSFYMKANVSRTMVVELADAGNNRHVNFAVTPTTVNTWERITLSIPADISGSFNQGTNSKAAEINFWLAAGTNYNSGSNQSTWTSRTAANIMAGASNWADTLGNTLWITGLQLEVGDTATPFEHRSFGEEIELCKRYYQKSSSYGVVPTNGSNATSVDNNTCVPFSNCVQWGGGGIGSYTPIYLPVTMRATPTVTAYGNSSGYLGYLNTGGSSPGSDNTVSYHVNLQLSPYREDRLVINNQATGDTIWGVVGGYECDSEL